MFSTRYMYYYHISILRMGTFLYILYIQLLILFMVLYFMAFEFRYTIMPCDFMMYVVAVVLPSKCLGYF